MVMLKATGKKRKKCEEGSRSSGRVVLAAWKSVVQPGFHRARFLTREERDIGMSPNSGGEQGEKLALAPCTDPSFVGLLLQNPTKP